MKIIRVIYPYLKCLCIPSTDLCYIGPLKASRLTQICGYVNDILVIARKLPALEAMCVEISREAGRVSLVIKTDKTKYMRFSASPFRRSPKGATVNGVTYEGVAEFIHLGTLVNSDNNVEKEI